MCEDMHVNPEVKRVLLFIAAFLFIVFGLVGLALPFLQGFLFLAIGLILLSIASPRARTWIESHTRKFPKVHEWITKIQKRVTDWIGDS